MIDGTPPVFDIQQARRDLNYVDFQIWLREVALRYGHTRNHLDGEDYAVGIER